MAYQDPTIPFDPYMVNTLATGGAYLGRGEITETTQLTDYYMWSNVALGNDRFAIFAYVKDATRNGDFIKVVTANAGGWQAEGDWSPVPTGMYVQRMTAVPMGTNRIVAVTERAGKAWLLDFSVPGTPAVIDSLTGLSISNFSSMRSYKVGVDGVLARSYDSAPRLTSLRVVGNDLVQLAQYTHDHGFPVEDENDPKWPINAIVPIGDKVLMMGTRQYVPNPTDYSWWDVDSPWWTVWDFETLTVLHRFAPMNPDVYHQKREPTAVALDDSSAFIYVPMYEFATPAAPNTSKGDAGWVATVTLDAAGMPTVQQHDGTQWPARVEQPPHSDPVVPNPWADPRRTPYYQKVLYVDWGQMFLVNPDVIAWVTEFGYDDEDDNEQVIFFWSIGGGVVLGWAHLKAGRGKQNDVDPLWLSSSESWNDQAAGRTSDGAILVGGIEYFQWNLSGGPTPWTESIWFYTVSLTIGEIAGDYLGARRRFRRL